MNKIEFKDIVKLIHPDINPSIKDPSVKMALIIEHKNDPFMLFELAKKWNILTDDILKRISFDDLLLLIDVSLPDSIDKIIEITEHQNDEKKLYELAEQWGLLKEIEIKYTIEEGKYVRVKDRKGIIVEVTPYNNRIFVMVDFNGNYERFTRHNLKDQDKDFFVTGYVNGSEYINVDLKYQMYKNKN